MSKNLGSTSAPGVITTYLDSLFAQSLANYSKTLVDNIGNSNPLLNKILKSDNYRSAAGGTDIREDLMYALAPADWYDGYDELSTVPTDGITQSSFDWAQLASPIAYSMKELKQNKQRLLNLVESRIKQSSMGIQEAFAVALWQGAAADGGAITSPRTSLVNGSSAILPIPAIIAFDPTATASIGNIAQNTYTWWRNRTKTSSATTYDGFLLEIDNLFNTCSLGTGGKPDLIAMDQVTYELFCHALYQKYRYTPQQVDEAFPFENVKYRGATVVLDDKVPDAYSASTTLTYGSAYYINSQYFALRYEEDSDFQMLKDENGKTFQKPTNGDSRVGHIAWMGAMTISNRRKHGVMGHIARTLT